MNSTVNVSDVERWASAIGGAALTVFGIKQLKDRSPAGAVLAAAGGALIYRGATGHCPMYAAAGISTASEHDRNGTRAALSGSGGVRVEEVITVDASPEQLYLFWRNFEQLPSFMDHLVVVTQVDALRSHWVAKAPMGRTVEWDAEIINEIDSELIAWRTLQGSDVVSAGSVRFKPAADDLGTEVRVRLQYDPPAGKIGATVAWLLGHNPSRAIREDLQRFKQLIEAREVAVTEDQELGIPS